jgi:tetratricopeptide (TPR) repeat protein
VRARHTATVLVALGALTAGALGIAVTLATSESSKWPAWLRPYHRWGWWVVLVLLVAATALTVWQFWQFRQQHEVEVRAKPHQLPVDVTFFTGRESELSLLKARLGGREPGPLGMPRIVAIEGIGGMGKSALAIHAAHQLSDSFPDGQLYADLQGTALGLEPGYPEEVAKEALGGFLRALGVLPEHVPSQVDEAAARYRSLLNGQRALIVLDNARDAGQVRQLLPASQTCAVLITSRTSLVELDGVQQMQLGAMSARESSQLLGRIAGHDRTAAEPEAATKIAVACGHLPLALRVAAGRLAARPTWPLQDLADRLADQHSRLSELHLGDLAVRASFQVSYQTLPPDLARSFRLLGLSQGPTIGAPAAAALFNQQVAPAGYLLERLVDLNLVANPQPRRMANVSRATVRTRIQAAWRALISRAAGRNLSGGRVANPQPGRREDFHPARYLLHDLLRLFAYEQVISGEPEAERTTALQRLLTFYLATAQRADEQIRPRRPIDEGATSPQQLDFKDLDEATEWLEQERETLLSAVQQAASMPSFWRIAGRLSTALRGFFELRSYFADWAQTGKAALSAAKQQRDGRAVATACLDLGILALQRHRLDEAMRYLEDALSGYRDAGDELGQARALGSIGNLHRLRGEYDLAVHVIKKGLHFRRKQGDRHGEAVTLHLLGLVCINQGNHDQGVTLFQRSLDLFGGLGDFWGQANVMLRLGQAYHSQGRYKQAIETLQQTLKLSRQQGHRGREAEVFTELGLVYRDLRRYKQAVAYLRDALTVRRSVDDEYGEATTLRELGKVMKARGRRRQAQAHLRNAITMFERVGAWPEAAEVKALIVQERHAA